MTERESAHLNCAFHTHHRSCYGRRPIEMTMANYQGIKDGLHAGRLSPSADENHLQCENLQNCLPLNLILSHIHYFHVLSETHRKELHYVSPNTKSYQMISICGLSK